MQKYLLEEKLDKSYVVMSAFIKVAIPLIDKGKSTTDFNFVPTGMGRTRIGEQLKAGESPYKFYNSANDKNSKALQREILVREFFNQSSQEFGQRPEESWLQDKSQDINFARWKNAETGYPLIDAGMTQLAKEGWMPNRVRMLCASFLTKNMGVYWQLGEKYFADKLVDYNRQSNIGNWLWVSGDGKFNNRITDVLSPDIQLLRFDPKAEYCNLQLGTTAKSARELIGGQNPVIRYDKSKLRFLRSVT
jgi:deoxyribodipyrimidine photo-lyase